MTDPFDLEVLWPPPELKQPLKYTPGEFLERPAMQEGGHFCETPLPYPRVPYNSITFGDSFVDS